ncbi:MFS transporter [Desulfurococcus mucosus]|nr:MFS transporter [Desulfurococcus mucosus]
MKGSRRYVATVLVLLVAYILVYFHRTMTGVMKPEVDHYARYYGVDANLLLAVMSSAYFYAYAVSQVFMGPLIDHYGVRRVGGVMLTLLGVATLVMSLPNPVSLIVGRTLIGVSATVAFLSYMRSSSLGFGPGSQGRLSSYALFAGGVSTVLATYPLRLMLNTAGISMTFLALAALAFMLAASVYMISPDNGNGGGNGSLLRQVAMLKDIAGSPHVWGVGLAAVASYGTGLAYQSAWGQIHLARVFSLGKDAVSLYLMLLAMVFVASSIPTGYLSDKLKKRRPFLLAATLVAVASWLLMFLSSYMDSTGLLLVSLGLLGLSQGLHVIAATMAKEPYDPAVSGTAVAFFNIILFMGIAVLQTICTVLNPLASILVNLLVAIAGSAATLTLVKETYPSKHA